MRRLLLTLWTCTLLGCGLCGCSKSKEAKSQPESESRSPSVATDGPAEMKIAWPVGRKYFFRLENSQSSEMTVPGQPKPARQAMKATQEFSISALKDLSDGGHELELEFLPHSSPSAAASGPPSPGDFFDRLAGSRLRYLTDKKGKVQEVRGSEELESRMMSNQPPQVRTLFKALFSQTNWKLYCSFADLLPTNAVSRGDTWLVQTELVSPLGAMFQNASYRFSEREMHESRNCVRLEQTGDFTPAPNSAASLKLENSSLSGQTWFDPALSMIVEFVTEQSMTRKVATRGKSLTMRTNQKTRLKLVKVEQAAGL
jgi:hypothetical protein